METKSKSEYICVNCGTKASALFKQHSSDVLRLYHCKNCDNVVDKYIEYDPTIIFIDVVLQQHQAYRHIIFNAGPKPFWKLAVILCLCDAFMLCINQREVKSQISSYGQFHRMIQLEWDFYLMIAVTFLQTLSFHGAIILLIKIFRSRFKVWSWATNRALIDGMIVGSFGKLLTIPALVWGQNDNEIYLCLAFFLIWLSQVHVYQAICGVTQAVAILNVSCAQFIEYCVRFSLLRLIAKTVDNTRAFRG